MADELAVEIAGELVKGKNGWILDGFPRNVVQAKGASWVLSADACLYLKIDEVIALSRVTGRGRGGDSEEKFRQRMKAERERMPSLLEYLSSRLPLVEIDANQEQEVVLSSTEEAIHAAD